MALQQQGWECLQQGINLRGVDGLQIAMPGRMDWSALWNDWVLISLKGVELVRGVELWAWQALSWFGDGC